MANTEVIDVDAPAVESKTAKELKKTPIGKFESIEEFTKNGFSEIMDATKALNALPQGGSRDLYCAYPAFGRVIDDQQDRILGIISKVLKWQNIKGNIQRRQPDEQFEMLQECNDIILERLNSNLDTMANINKPTSTVLVESRIPTTPTLGSGAGSWNMKTTNKFSNAKLLTAKNIARPQINFPIPVDNSRSTPFIPKIKDKPNSLKPLAVLPEYDDAGMVVSYLHPYEFELDKFEIGADYLKRKSPTKPPGVQATPYTYVDTVEELQKALNELRNESELAVDVEHHSYRSFQGFTCLVQISTRSKDYLFDALALREEMHVLNEVFTDRKIVKIFHGADSDVEWLQRDLSIYIVNMFDTHQAAKALNFARLSLAYVLKHYCDVDADKTFQLADWRIRPLPEELIAYARQDTRFLIYIYECMTNDLLDISNQQSNVLRSVFERSTELCKKRYIKTTINSESYVDMYRKSKRIFDNRQLFALREIFQWRDSIARQEDESYGYVLPNHMMLHISESLPREMQGILACCNPVPPLVRQNLHQLHQIILRAREQPLVKPIMEVASTNRIAEQNVKDYNNKLYCPHDLPHNVEFRDDLPTLLVFRDGEFIRQPQPVAEPKKLTKPIVGFFSKRSQLADITHLRQSDMFGRIPAITPYQRYVAMLPIAEKEKREEAERLEAERKKRKLCPAEPSQPIEVEKKETIPVDQKPHHDGSLKEILKRQQTNDQQTKAKRAKPNEPATPSTPSKETPTKNETAESEPVHELHDSDSDSDGPPEQMPSTSATKSKFSTIVEKPKSKLVNKKKFKAKQRRNDKQGSDKPVPAAHSNFDYNKVDFKKFQGGSQRARGPDIKGQFQPKNNPNKANNKKFNKLFTFSNTKGKK